jgi:N-acetylglucosaminyldiphosphoundecaprenol N-acetyl-beta-D-mannosaminyltransferase
MTTVLSNLPSTEPNLEQVSQNHASQSPRYANVLGVRISAVNMQNAVRLAEEWILRGMPGYVCLAGVHGVMEAQRDPNLLEIMNQAALNLPDGMPMTWVGRLQGLREIDRVFGPDFMMVMCKLSAERAYRNYLFGGKPGVAEELRNRLRECFPDLEVVGTFTPPFRPMNSDEERELIAEVARLKPHILWVGLSTPKQERFMARMAGRLRVPLMVGVGAAFDYHTGKIRDCPDWVKRAGMQWLHRLMQDPRRLWKRYLRNNPAFLWHIAVQLGSKPELRER